MPSLWKNFCKKWPSEFTHEETLIICCLVTLSQCWSWRIEKTCLSLGSNRTPQFAQSRFAPPSQSLHSTCFITVILLFVIQYCHLLFSIDTTLVHTFIPFLGWVGPCPIQASNIFSSSLILHFILTRLNVFWWGRLHFLGKISSFHWVCLCGTAIYCLFWRPMYVATDHQTIKSQHGSFIHRAMISPANRSSYRGGVHLENRTCVQMHCYNWKLATADANII